MYQSRANSVRNSASTSACTTIRRRRLFCEAFGRIRTAAMDALGSVRELGRTGPLEEPHQDGQEQRSHDDVPEQGDRDHLDHLTGGERVVAEDDATERED